MKLNRYQKWIYTCLNSSKRWTTLIKPARCSSLEDARWHLSATLNFMYADAKMDYEIVPLDTVFVYIPLNNGQIGMDDFSNAFYEVTDFLSAKYQQIEATDKTLNLVSVSVTGQTDDEAELMAISMMAYNPGLSWEYPFGEGDWWYWGWGKGRCGSYEGQNFGSDAAKRLTLAANITVPAIASPFGRVYWTDDINIIVIADYHPDPNSPCGYKLFLSHTPIDEGDPNFQHSCLSPDDMNYYFLNIIGFGVEMKPPGLTLMGYYVSDDILMWNYQSFPRHTLDIHYGVPNVTPWPPNEL